MSVPAPLVNVLYTQGTNSHRETMWAFERVGARTRLLHLVDVLSGVEQLDSGDALCIPGGFSYGDHLGAGSLAAHFLRRKLSDQVARARTKPIIGICNGYQVAIKAGLFGDNITLDLNSVGTFRSIIQQPHIVDTNTKSVWLAGLQGADLSIPCAHVEGRFRYNATDGWEPAVRYPAGNNPDGSDDDIAAISSDDGLVLGIMNHPERLLDSPGNLEIFANGVKAAAA
jgi:phosphoribosylformylglycinamidine (FGAM) synthase-like amidotransferase family enzyme